jgi:hypothetical protein
MLQKQQQRQQQQSKHSKSRISYLQFISIGGSSISYNLYPDFFVAYVLFLFKCKRWIKFYYDTICRIICIYFLESSSSLIAFFKINLTSS